jgi:hypothetical protein
MGTRLGNFRKNNTEIPVLELKKYVDAATISNYQSLISLNRGFSVRSKFKKLMNFKKLAGTFIF